MYKFRHSAGRALTSAKDNLNNQRAAWNKRASCYYLFDSTSRTASQLYEGNLCLSQQETFVKIPFHLDYILVFLDGYILSNMNA